MSRTDEVMLALNRHHAGGEAASIDNEQRYSAARQPQTTSARSTLDVENAAPSRLWPGVPAALFANTGALLHTLQQVAEGVALKMHEQPLSAAPGTAANPEAATVRIMLGEQKPQQNSARQLRWVSTVQSWCGAAGCPLRAASLLSAPGETAPAQAECSLLGTTGGRCVQEGFRLLQAQALWPGPVR